MDARPSYVPFVPSIRGANPFIVGHRGAPSCAPENTPEAFAAAARAGADWVELDVRRCADGTLAVHHDPITHPDNAALVDLDASALAAHHVWSLEAVLASMPAGLGVDLELKNLPGELDYDDTHALVDRLAIVLAPVIGRRPLMASSFNPLTVQRLVERLPSVPAGLLHGPGLGVDAAGELARDLGARAVCPHADARPLDAEAVQAAHERGLAVMVWVVDDPAEAERLAAEGVDALCTNEPALLVQRLRGGSTEHPR